MSETGKHSGKVLFVGHEASMTGAPIVLLRFLRWLKENGTPQFRILLGAGGKLLPDFERLSPVDTFEPETSLWYRGLRRLHLEERRRRNHLDYLCEKLRVEDIRLIYANTIVTAKLVEFLSFLDCPVVCHVHELEGNISVCGDDNVARMDKLVCQYIAVSDAVRKNLVELHGIQSRKIQVIPNSVPVEGAFRPDASEAHAALCNELGVSQDSRFVCGCGSIEKGKGTDLFLQVAEHVRDGDAGRNVHFIWVGGKPDAVRSMRRRAEVASLGGIVHFLGLRDDVSRFFRASEVFILTSREESASLVILEASLQEIPVVCFDRSGGATEFVNGDVGIVTPPYDTKRMAEAVSFLLRAPNHRRELGLKAREKVFQRHRLSLRATEVRAVIEEVISRNCSTADRLTTTYSVIKS